MPLVTMLYNPLFMCNYDVILPIAGKDSYWYHVWNCNWSLDRLKRALQIWWQDKCSNEYSIGKEDAKVLFPLAVELFLIFVQNNFTGPFDHVADFEELINKLDFDYGKFDKFSKSGAFDVDGEHIITANDMLKTNNEEVNANVKLSALLVCARDIFRCLMKYDSECLLYRWWYFRLICVHQHVIDTLTISLYEAMVSEGNWMLHRTNTLKNLEYEIMLRLELANAYLQFRRPMKANRILDALTSNLNIELNVTGLLGMRTKFQVKPLPQLCLLISQKKFLTLPTAMDTNGNTKLPQLLVLDDDTRLERVNFVNATDNVVMTLPSILQALLLTKLYCIKYLTTKDPLTDEQVEPYVRTLLYQEYGPLQLRLSLLLLNCYLEGNQRRTIERSWKQCEEIVKLMRDNKYTISEKLSYAFVSYMKPHWHVQMQLAEHLITLGMVKTAVDIYQKTKAWYELIACYSSIEMKHKAAEIIQQELDKKPTALLYCLMGNARDDPTYYEMAWNFSQQTSARAKAHWGNYFYQHGKYAEAIPHFEQSLQINSLQENLWLRLGYSATITENWKLAVHAYITYTHLDPFGYESWNNLAKALIKLGDKKRAHKVLIESLKCNHNNWKIWENFLVVSLDIHHYNDVISAYNRLTELRHHYLDLEILTHLVNAITKDVRETGSLQCEKLIAQASKLMSQQCIIHSSIPQLWELAAILAPSPMRKSEKLIKAYRTHTAKNPLWPTNYFLSKKLLTLCNGCAKNALDAINSYLENESSGMITSQLHSARLTAESCVSAIEKGNNLFVDNDPILNELRKFITMLNESIKARQTVSK